MIEKLLQMKFLDGTTFLLNIWTVLVPTVVLLSRLKHNIRQDWHVKQDRQNWQERHDRQERKDRKDRINIQDMQDKLHEYDMRREAGHACL